MLESRTSRAADVTTIATRAILTHGAISYIARDSSRLSGLFLQEASRHMKLLLKDRVRRRLLDWFVPPQLQADTGASRQALEAIAFGLAMLFWTPSLPVFYVLGSPRGGAMLVCVAFAILGSMLSLRLTRSVWTTGNLISTSVFAVLIAITTVTGGIGAPALWWLPSVPIIALVICGVGSGTLWASISCLACIFFYVAAARGWDFPADLTPEGMRVLDCMAVCGIVLCAFILTLLFKFSEAESKRDLEIARQASEEANRAKSRFLANMSHEIRTPMNAIIGMTDLALETSLSKEQRTHLNVVRDSSETLLVLVNDLFDFATIESGKMLLDNRLFDIHGMLNSTLKAMSLRAHEKGLELLCDLDRRVPKFVIGDHNRLRQVIFNLIDNAIKFTEAGEILVEVRQQSETERNVRLEFTVADTGIGIPQSRQAAVFEVFEQADTSTTRRYGGMGLGLSISARLVESMDGKLTVESEVGQGSKFSFVLSSDAPTIALCRVRLCRRTSCAACASWWSTTMHRTGGCSKDSSTIGELSPQE